MGLFDLLKPHDINEGVKVFSATPDAVLLDVRKPDEYASGHIPGSVNLPLSLISKAGERLPNKNAPLFVYCLAGTRSSRAIGTLKAMGYTNLRNIGGIRSWHGTLEK